MNKKMIKNAIIFAAGKGTRMSPLTDYTPKPLIKVNGEPMIERNIIFLKEVGINDITIVVGYLKSHFNYLEKYGEKIVENDLFSIQNNISSMNVTKNIWGDTIYIEGDIYLKYNILPDLIEQIDPLESTMFGAKAGQDMDEWKFNFNDDFEIIDHSSPALSGDYIWTGIYYVNEKMGREIPLKISEFLENDENKQKYAEQFLWTLVNRFTLKEINKNSFYELDNFSDLIKIDKTYSSHGKLALFTPGPTNVLKELWESTSRGIVHHRSKLAEFYISDLYNKMKWAFNTKKGTPIFLTASGTGAMEAAMVNSVKKGDTVGIISNGDFGERFIEIAKTLDINFIPIRFPKFQAIDMDVLKKKMGDIDVLFVTHHETSTGVLNDIEKIGSLTTEKGILLVVDSISSLITNNINFDDWGIDIALASSPKAFALPPGLSFLCLSEKAIRKIYEVESSRYYFDLRKYIEYFRDHKQTPFTPAIQLIVGMCESIEIIQKQTLEEIRRGKKEIFDYLKTNLIKLGFIDPIKNGDYTISMLTLLAPENINVLELREYVSNEFGVYFSVGRETTNNIVRIGLLGPVSLEAARKLVRGFKQYILGKSNRVK